MRRLFSLALFGAATVLFTGCRASVTSIGALMDGGTSDDVPADGGHVATGHYLEAEDGELSGGFTIGTAAVASGGRYIEAPAGASSTGEPGPAHARYTVEISSPGTYLVWGRIHSPDANHNTLWVQVDSGDFHLWRISTGDVFYWDDVHDGTNYGSPIPFELDAGAHEITFASSVEKVELDRVYVTADGDRPVGDDTPCHPPDSIELGGVCQPSCGSQGGNACGDEACRGLPILPAYDCVVCCTAL